MRSLEWRPEDTTAVPRIVSFCHACAKETCHELREGDGVIAKVCLSCLERELAYLLDLD